MTYKGVKSGYNLPVIFIVFFAMLTVLGFTVSSALNPNPTCMEFFSKPPGLYVLFSAIVIMSGYVIFWIRIFIRAILFKPGIYVKNNNIVFESWKSISIDIGKIYILESSVSSSQYLVIVAKGNQRPVRIALRLFEENALGVVEGAIGARLRRT